MTPKGPTATIIDFEMQRRERRIPVAVEASGGITYQTIGQIEEENRQRLNLAGALETWAKNEGVA